MMKKLILMLVIIMTFVIMTGCGFEADTSSDDIQEITNDETMSTDLNNAQEITNDETKELIITKSQYQYYNSIHDLIDFASDIVAGTIVNSRVETFYTSYDLNGQLLDDGIIYTIFTLLIQDVYKGNYSIGDYIEVKQPGGETEYVINVTDEPTLDIENSYVFFLYSEDDWTVPASYLNPTQSIYYYDSDSRDISQNLTSVSDRNNFHITYEQLRSIASIGD